MPVKPKIRPTQVDYKGGHIKPTSMDDTQKVSFNFKCLTSKSDKFKYQEQEKNYFNKVLERLRDISRMTRKELTINNVNDKSLRCHTINFNETSEACFGLPREGDLYDDAWQFEISQNAHGRVHGYFVGNVFYIVWLDPEHELYSKK